MSSVATQAQVDDDGVRLGSVLDATIDVELDGRRVWSFKPERDGRKVDGGCFVPWPEQLAPYMVGVGHLTVREHGAEVPLFDGEVRLGGSEDPLRIEDGKGKPLEVMKTGRLTHSYADRSSGIIDAVVDAAQAAVRFVEENDPDVTVFLAYGGLLGAVREGEIIGHDNDLDLVVLYPESIPVDMIRHSYDLERRFVRAGWVTYRYSAAAFKVQRKGEKHPSTLIDMFGAWKDTTGRIYFMPNLHAEPDTLQLTPVSEVTLEGRTFPAPHDQEGWLELIYGPSWRVPDPAWKWEPDHWINRSISGWTRSAIKHRNHWWPRHGMGAGGVPKSPSAFARWVAEQTSPGALLDVGCGSGRDALWFADQGYDVLGIDYAPGAVHRGTRVARRRGIEADFKRVNLLDARQTLGLGGQLAFEQRPHDIYGRWLVDSLNAQALENLWRLCSMATRHGGKVYLEFRALPPEETRRPREPGHLYRRRTAGVVTSIERAGGRVLHLEEDRGLAAKNKKKDAYVGRLVATWQ